MNSGRVAPPLLRILETAMIHRSPDVVQFAINLHLDLGHVPFPVALGAHHLDALTADLSGDHWVEPVPPVPHGFMADLDPSLMQQVLNV